MMLLHSKGEELEVNSFEDDSHFRKQRDSWHVFHFKSPCKSFHQPELENR